MGRKSMATSVARAQQHLAAADPVMAGLITHYGKCTLWRREFAPFPTLCRAIIGQQISTRAAETVEARVLQTLGTDTFAPEPMLAAADDALRAAGLSRAKLRYLRALAEADGNIDWDGLQALDDAAVTATLTAIPGIGPWTAEMFLIFVLRRPDVFSPGDAGLRGTINRLYADGEKLSLDEVRAIAAPWAPWRSVACWYLWRVADGDIASW